MGEYDHPIGASPFVPHVRGACEIGNGISSPSPHSSFALIQEPPGEADNTRGDMDMHGNAPFHSPSANEATLCLLDCQSLNPGNLPTGPSASKAALRAASVSCHNLDPGAPPQPPPCFPTAHTPLDAPHATTPAHPLPSSHVRHLSLAAPSIPYCTASRTPHKDDNTMNAGPHFINARDTPAGTSLGSPLVAFRRPANPLGLHSFSGAVQKVKAGPIGKPARMSYVGITRKGPVWAAPAAKGQGTFTGGTPKIDTPLTRWLTGVKPRCTGESTPRADDRPSASAPAVQRTPSGAQFGSRLRYSPCPASEPAGRVVLDSCVQTSGFNQPFCSRKPLSPAAGADRPCSCASPLNLEGAEDPGNVRGEPSSRGADPYGVAEPGERSIADGNSRPRSSYKPAAGSPMLVRSSSAGRQQHDNLSTASVQASHAGDANGRPTPAFPSCGTQVNGSAPLTWPLPTRDAGCGPCVSEGSALVADGGNNAFVTAHRLLPAGVGESAASDGVEGGGVGAMFGGGGLVATRGKACPGPAEAGGALVVGRETREAHLGIRVVLVSADLRRQGIAQKLLDVAR